MGMRVLMIGPGFAVTGGISALNQTVVPVLGQRVDLLYLPTVQQRPLSESGKVSLRNLGLIVSQYLRFLAALWQFRPHIIHIHTSWGIAWLKDTFFILVGKALRRPVVLHMHGGIFAQAHSSSRRWMQSYTRLMIGLVDAVIEISAARAAQLAQIAAPRRLVVLRNCIDTRALTMGPKDHSQSASRALFLGVVGRNKGAFDLLQAMAALKEKGCPLQLWLAGDEEAPGDLAKARALARELDVADRCRFVGLVRGAGKTRLLREADMLVLPSYYEGLPMAILEAMAAGLPIVATHVGGVPEVVQDGYNGFLVAPGDIEALAARLAILATDPDLRAAMGERSRESAERELDVRQYADRLVALYESVEMRTKAGSCTG